MERIHTDRCDPRICHGHWPGTAQMGNTNLWKTSHLQTRAGGAPMKRTKFKLDKNSTNIGTREVKQIIRFILDHLGVFREFRVILTNSHTGWVGGHAGVCSSYMLLRVPLVKRLRYSPYQYAH